MLLKLFSSNRIGVLAIIILLPVLFWMPDFWLGKPPHDLINAGTLPGVYLQNFNRDNRIFSQVIALAIILANAFLLDLLNRIYIFIPGKTQLPALFYIMLAACFTPLHQLSAALLASFLLIIFLYRVIVTYKVEGISYNFLDAGILVSLASLLYFPAILFFILLIEGLILLRPFNWREWVYAIIGLSLPYLFLFSGYFLADRPVSNYFPGLSDVFSRNRQHFTPIQIASWAYVVSMLLYGSYFMVTSIDSMKIQGRKIFMHFLWLFLLSGVIYLTLPGTGMETVYFASIPLAFLFSHFFYKCEKNWINEILFTLFFLFIIMLRII